MDRRPCTAGLISAQGRSLDGKTIPIAVGLARPGWSSQPLATDQTGWDWFRTIWSRRADAVRLRHTDTKNFFSGSWIGLTADQSPLDAASP